MKYGDEHPDFVHGGPAPADRLLPTPVATDGSKVATNSLARLAQYGEMSTPGDNRDGRSTRDEGVVRNDPRPSNGKLNPAWVEWVMGFPAGWSELP